MMRDEDPCARCGRLTAHDDLRLFTRRERLREFTRRAPLSAPASLPAPSTQVVRARITEPPGPTDAAASPEGAAGAAPAPTHLRPGRAVSYRWVTTAHAVCPECHAVVETDAARFHDHDRRRFVVVILACVALAALMWVSFTTFMPNWIAAFWRNGAGGR